MFVPFPQIIYNNFAFLFVLVRAQSLRSCLILRDPMDCSPPDSCVHGILQARILEWVAISFSDAWKWRLSRVRLLAIPWTAAYQAPLSMGFSRQGYWSGCPFPSPGDLPNPGIEPVSLMSPALAGDFFTSSTTWEALICHGEKKIMTIYVNTNLKKINEHILKTKS